MSLGFEKISEEYPTGIIYTGYAHGPYEAYVDVVGFKGGSRPDGRDDYYPTSWDRICIIECGDTPRGKLRTLARHFDEVYHLPYDGEIERVKRKPKEYWWETE